jgi:transcriptional regulator with XRE-family HTH domain
MKVDSGEPRGARDDSSRACRRGDIERENLEALEAGRLVPADDLLLALSDVLGIEADALGSYLDTAAVLAAFGHRVRELREKRGLSQDALGRLARGLRVPPRALIEDDGERAALGA